ncbi:Protein-disulfide isomerase [Micromonospora phaseoli]|uniref:Protein-disulfide isomerase n=1 Tax=Micromonospora phaseoli TaxID=1144548 RepID=A0A1H7D1P4_9ACTN|nr:thioredoxin domain-containing protein [Micromonospora phaseoli]PZV91506.1 protein-disulfide isomerase [Micromonospora phaseoli]GIJ80087.1 membrane protein [Micromonospora phaseoli]SEJ92980.1 Protein-disulfide isomerase [Micromonospora phaseoli]
MSSRKGRKDAARVVREQLARERRRKRTLWISLGAVVVLVIAGLIGWSVWSGQQSDEYTAPPGANDAGTGVVVGSGPVTIDIYEDYLCPACKQFEQSSGATIAQLISDGKVRVVYHPVAFLNRYSSTEYSTRSSAASGCAAEGGRFTEFSKALFERQPPEGGAGLSNDELIDIGVEVGLDRDAFGSCVRDGKYQSWTDHVTDEATRANITGTPSILVDGEPVREWTPENITAAVEAAGR